MKREVSTLTKRKLKSWYFPKQKHQQTCKIILEEELEQVSSFDYLGSLVTSDGKCLRDIKKRIALAKQAFNNKKTTLTNKKISIETKKRFLKIYVWSTLLYGCISKEAQNHLEAAEMWFYRRLIRIPWTQKKTNEEVLSKILEKRMIVNEIRKRQLRFVGHIKRENGLESMCLEGKIERSKGRGRPRANFLDGLALASGRNGIQILRSAEDRLVFREMVANVRL